MEFQYNSEQMQVIEKARKVVREEEKLKIIENPKLSHGQMQEALNGFKEGLTAEQVSIYAKPEIKIENMNLYRYGLRYTIPEDKIKEIVERNGAWDEKSRWMDQTISENRLLIAKDLNRHGFKSSIKMVKEIEEYNHLTHKQNTIREIGAAYKENRFKDEPEIQKSLKEIGNELRDQELQKKMMEPNMER